VSEQNESTARPAMSGAARRIAEELAAKQAAERRRKKTAVFASFGAVLVVALGIGLAYKLTRPEPAAPKADLGAIATEPKVTAGTGNVDKLLVTTLIQGNGPATKNGQTITANYTGVTFKDGKQFDSSWSRHEPITFRLGVGDVIKGWDQGLLGVKVGSRVMIDIPGPLAYGDAPNPDGRPHGPLRFVVDVRSAQD